MNQKRAGILYCAKGDDYLKMARKSALSIKKFNSEIPCSVCTSEDTCDPIWDQIIPLDPKIQDHDQYMLDKLYTLTKSPYLNTLYLDADTYVLEDIDSLFSILQRFDLAICHGYARQLRFDIQTGRAPHRGKYTTAINPEIPYAFAPVQGGLILYKKNNKTDKWLSDLYNLYKKKEFYDDQVSMRELLWTSDLSFYILPTEYNFISLELLKYWKKNHYKLAKPKIFHYAGYKNFNIEKIIYSIYKPNKSNWQDFKIYSGRFPWLPKRFKYYIKKNLIKIKALIIAYK